MNYRRRIGTIAAGLLATTAVAACGPDTKQGEPVDVTHQSASQSISDNTLSVSASLAASLEMLDDSQIFAAGVDAAAGATSDASLDCADFNDTDGCAVPEPEPELDLDATINQGSQAMVDMLRDHVFVDANIETEAQTEITYLLRGDVLCPALEGEVGSGGGAVPIDGSAPLEDGTSTDDVPVDTETTLDSSCVEQLDSAEIRLRVTSPLPGDIDVAVLVGPQRYNPASFQFHQTMLAAELDLAGLKASIEHLATVAGDDSLELPAVMAGRIRAELSADSDRAVTGTFSVLTPVDIQHPELSLQLAAASPASSLTIDGTRKRIEAESNLGALDLDVLMRTYSESVDEMGNFTETVEEDRIGVALAGMTGSMAFDVGTETVTMTGLGLGNGAATLDYNGAQIVSVDLNKNDGRTFDATISQASSDDVQIAVSPLFDLQVGLSLGNAPELAADADPAMLDDTLTVLLAGDPNPVILLGASGLEVLRGTFSMGLTNEGSLIEVQAGQCLRSIGDEPTPIDGTGTEPTEPTEPAGPFDGLEAGSCG
jgi:hypothetical protein